MSTAKHTEGPWDCEAEYANPKLLPFQADKPVQTIMGNDGDVAYLANWHNDNTEREANARLIAAAPELLEALRELVSAHDLKMGRSAVEVRLAIAKDAIAKAEEAGQ